jgi:aspartyl-tRNA(Asn)/glutamyl-tRNA(Gln) amidotransferase subunit C
MLSKEEVKHVALLARIGIKDEEVEKYQGILSGVLDFFRDLEKADVNNLSVPRQIIGRESGVRVDRVVAVPASQIAGILNNVPEMKDKYVKVKSVF